MTEGLIGLLQKAKMDGLVKGHSICQGAPSISHLLFANDSIFFCTAFAVQAREIKAILGIYKSCSGQ